MFLYLLYSFLAVEYQYHKQTPSGRHSVKEWHSARVLWHGGSAFVFEVFCMLRSLCWRATYKLCGSLHSSDGRKNWLHDYAFGDLNSSKWYFHVMYDSVPWNRKWHINIIVHITNAAVQFIANQANVTSAFVSSRAHLVFTGHHKQHRPRDISDIRQQCVTV